LQNVLVTGGAGFIGSAFVRHLLRTHPDVRIVNLDALTYAGRPENLVNLPDPARHERVIGDIGDQALCERLLHERAIDTIVHFAAHTHVDRSHHPDRSWTRT
jgi:dTDP-glucose 4,6-dehydratase